MKTSEIQGHNAGFEARRSLRPIGAYAPEGQLRGIRSLLEFKATSVWRKRPA